MASFYGSKICACNLIRDYCQYKCDVRPQPIRRLSQRVRPEVAGPMTGSAKPTRFGLPKTALRQVGSAIAQTPKNPQSGRLLYTRVSQSTAMTC